MSMASTGVTSIRVEEEAFVLYRSTDRLCHRGAAIKNLAHANSSMRGMARRSVRPQMPARPPLRHETAHPTLFPASRPARARRPGSAEPRPTDTPPVPPSSAPFMPARQLRSAETRPSPGRHRQLGAGRALNRCSCSPWVRHGQPERCLLSVGPTRCARALRVLRHQTEQHRPLPPYRVMLPPAQAKR